MIRLKELSNAPKLGQLTDWYGEDQTDMTRWIDCCRVFQIDPSETGMDERVYVAGLKHPLFQYQAFAVYWQMITSRTCGGGFMADSPGLGKTLTFLSLLVVERQLCRLWREVNRSRETKDGRHLPLKGQLANDVCPTLEDRPGWIACPCAFSSPTSQMPAREGVRIAIVPASLISNWRAEWKKHIDPNSNVTMKLLIAHKGSVAACKEINEMADNHYNRTSLTYRTGEENVLVLTTAQGYDAWNHKFEEQHGYGIACADEAHEDYKIDKGRAGVLGRLPGRPFCWAYSGTLLDKTPRCLEGLLWAIEKNSMKIDEESERTGWAQKRELYHCSREIFDSRCKNFESYQKSGTTDPNLIFSLHMHLMNICSLLMIRRTPDSKWFGHPLIARNSNLHRDVFLMHNGKFDEEIKVLDHEIKADYEDRLQRVQAIWDEADKKDRPARRPTTLGLCNAIHTQYKLRILATCPWLIKLTTGKNALTLKTDELKKWRGIRERSSPYAKNLANIFENSPKLMWLRECILNLAHQGDAEGNEQKMVIISNFNCIAHIVKLVSWSFLRTLRL